MNNRNIPGRAGKAACILLALLLCVTCAGAESLFSLIATPSPVPTVAPLPAAPAATAVYEDGMFSLLATATPGPEASPAPSAPAGEEDKPEEEALFSGLGFGDMTGRKADRIERNDKEGSPEYVYERVTEEDFTGYMAFLNDMGCEIEQTEENGGKAVSGFVYNTDADCAFLLEYRRDEETLTLIGAAEDEDNDIEAVFPEETAPEKEVTVCSHCVRGHCKTCRGRGVVKCPECLGLGRCRACHGSGGIQTIGWGGVGTSAFIPCAECGGNGRCPGCDGKGRVECTECEHGVCKYCQGNYVISP